MKSNIFFILLFLTGLYLNFYILELRKEKYVEPVKTEEIKPKALLPQTKTNLPDHITIDFNPIIKKLIQIETGGNKNLVGDNGSALGLLQIRPGCVRDINMTYHTNFKHSDALDSLKSVVMCELYLQKGIKLYIKKHKKYPTVEQIVRMWNGGIYKGYLYASTEKYYHKFLKT